jgi:exopolysaccharide biosynthesis polyprenyl glycosylphosphotransferase
MYKNKNSRHVLNIVFTILRVLSDSTCIFLAFVLAYIAKFKTADYPHAQIEPYLAVLPYVIILWLVAFALVGLYKTPKGLLARLNEMTLLITGVSFGTLEVMAFSFAYPDFPTSRFVLGYTYIFALIFAAFARSIIHAIELSFFKHGIGNMNSAIIGTTAFGQTIGEKMLMYPTLGYHLLGFIDSKKPAKINYHLRNNKLKMLGKLTQLADIIEKNNIEVLFIARQDLSETQILEVVSHCEQNNVELKMVPSFFELRPTSLDVNSLDGIPMVSFKKTVFQKSKRIYKRIFDIFTASVMIILTSPISLLATVMIKISSPNGPVIFRQVRVGEGGKPFKFLKFRTMPVNVEEKTGPVWATSSQRKRTIGVGNLLRKTSIDELPQLFNVLKGEMSIVGPRPERPFFVKKLEKSIVSYHDRHLVKGGITGWAQINGRSFLTAKPEEKLKYDIYYIENWSPLFDVKILLKTITDVLFQRNAF